MPDTASAAAVTPSAPPAVASTPAATVTAEPPPGQYVLSHSLYSSKTVIEI